MKVGRSLVQDLKPTRHVVAGTPAVGVRHLQHGEETSRPGPRLAVTKKVADQ